MPHLTLDLSVEEIKSLVFQLPAQQLIEVAEAVEERSETIGMMRLAETGFREWEDEGEDLYDAET